MAAHRLLIVEDDAVLRSQLSRGLGEEGFEIIAAGDEATALECAGNHPNPGHPPPITRLNNLLGTYN